MRRVSIVVALALAASVPAAAQDAPRWTFGLSGGVQPANTSVSDHFEFERNLEQATVDARYPAESSTLIDGGIGIRLWKSLGAGVSTTRATATGAAEISARLPHPFQFNQYRSIEGTLPGVTRTETAIHFQALLALRLSSSVTLTLSGGPSHVRVEQDLASDVQYDESYPYDTATFKTATTKTAKGSAAGFNGGVDIAWMFSKHFGIGGLVRYTGGRVSLETSDNRTVRVDAGGAQAGGGVRLAF